MRKEAVALATLCLAGCLASGSLQQGDPKPDFSGTWVFQADRSSLEIPVPESSVFTIDHQDPHWRVERTHVYGGREDTLGFELLTDGVPAVRVIRGTEIHTRLHWEGGTLVFEASYTRGGKEVTNVVRYRLTEEGRTFIAEERMESEQGSHLNIWVLERQ